MHAYEVRPRKDECGVDLISDALPFGRLCYSEPKAVSKAVDYAKFRTRSHNAVIGFCKPEMCIMLLCSSNPHSLLVLSLRLRLIRNLEAEITLRLLRTFGKGSAAVDLAIGIAIDVVTDSPSVSRSELYDDRAAALEF
jgi:hypothetical protein